MRMVLAALVAIIGTARADTATSDRVQAQLQAATATNLARDGHCREALALRPRIARLDAEVATRAFSDEPALAACVATSRPAADDDASLEEPLVPPPGHCSTGAYLSPSLVGGVGTRSLALHRLSAGITIRSCVSPMVFAFGATAFLGKPGGGGGGAELEVSRWTRGGARVGGHLSLEKLGGDGFLASLDARYHIDDVEWLGVGLYGGRDPFGGALLGGTVGFGIEGAPGAAIGGVELGIGALFGLFVLYAISHQGT